MILARILYNMGEVKDRLKDEISDDEMGKEKVPAIIATIGALEIDSQKKLEMQKSFPGILFMGDWHESKINRKFFEGIIGELRNPPHFINAYTLYDIIEELNKRKMVVGELEIRKRGLDSAHAVLWVDGNGKGTISESTAICMTDGWNKKCNAFVSWGAGDDTTLFKEKPFLADFINPIIKYGNIDELRAKLITNAIRLAKNWVNEKMASEDHDKK